MPDAEANGTDGSARALHRTPPPGLGLALYVFALGMLAVAVAYLWTDQVIDPIGRSRLAAVQESTGIPIAATVTRVEHRAAGSERVINATGSGSTRIASPERWRIAFDIAGPSDVPTTGSGELSYPVAVGDTLPGTFVPGGSGAVLLGAVQPPGLADWAWAVAALVGGSVVLIAAARLLYRILDPLIVLVPIRRRAWFAANPPGPSMPPRPVLLTVVVLLGALFGGGGLLLLDLASGVLADAVTTVANY